MSIAYGILLCETSKPQIFDGFVELSIERLVATRRLVSSEKVIYTSVLSNVIFKKVTDDSRLTY